MFSKPPQKSKVRKQDTLYVLKPIVRGKYQCAQCWLWLSESERCLAHGPDDVIKDIGSCGYWLAGEPQKSGKPKSSVTKAESGYVESEPGFGCHRCEEFDGKSQCEKVSGFISPLGCCAAWEAEDGDEN